VLSTPDPKTRHGRNVLRATRSHRGAVGVRGT